MDVKIRNASLTEALTLTRLALRSKAYWGYVDEFMHACREELSVTPGNIENSNAHYAVATVAHQIIGFYALERLAEADFELTALFVEPDHIGTGIGRELILHARNKALSLGAASIVIQADPNAARFYEAAGGILIGKKESGSIPGRYLPLYKVPLEAKKS